MEANDLMIGDWVYRIDFKNPVPSKIIGIEVVNYDKMEYVVDVLNKNGYNVQLYLNEIKPIPLTAEILKKSGFIKDNNCWVLCDKYTGDEIIALFEVAKGFAMPTSGLPIGFQEVHELQHLFRLYGIDKEIEL